ncbi:MAG: hypothetical protein WDM70_03555 [Nitrosomonadales bacterium]
MFNLRSFLFLFGCLLLLADIGIANATAEVKIGEPENYCVVYCYIRVPFSIANYEATHKIGRVFCDFDVEVTAQLPIYNSEAKTKSMQASSIGVFKVRPGKLQGMLK